MPDLVLPYVPGSSPLTRGTHPDHFGCHALQRFIPAHAGNTIPVREGHFANHGSSPLTRGTRDAVVGQGRGVRFIPAHAGNTGTTLVAVLDLTVHPRSRGEHGRRCRHGNRVHGSSPLTRGTPILRTRARLPHRFIPAHAGNTAGSAARDPTSAVHPRSRGEH